MSETPENNPRASSPDSTSVPSVPALPSSPTLLGDTDIAMLNNLEGISDDPDVSWLVSQLTEETQDAKDVAPGTWTGAAEFLAMSKPIEEPSGASGSPVEGRSILQRRRSMESSVQFSKSFLAQAMDKFRESKNSNNGDESPDALLVPPASSERAETPVGTFHSIAHYSSKPELDRASTVPTEPTGNDIQDDGEKGVFGGNTRNDNQDDGEKGVSDGSNIQDGDSDAKSSENDSAPSSEGGVNSAVVAKGRHDIPTPPLGQRAPVDHTILDSTHGEDADNDAGADGDAVNVFGVSGVPALQMTVQNECGDVSAVTSSNNTANSSTDQDTAFADPPTLTRMDSGVSTVDHVLDLVDAQGDEAMSVEDIRGRHQKLQSALAGLSGTITQNIASRAERLQQLREEAAVWRERAAASEKARQDHETKIAQLKEKLLTFENVVDDLDLPKDHPYYNKGQKGTAGRTRRGKTPKAKRPSQLNMKLARDAVKHLSATPKGTGSRTRARATSVAPESWTTGSRTRRLTTARTVSSSGRKPQRDKPKRAVRFSVDGSEGKTDSASESQSPTASVVSTKGALTTDWLAGGSRGTVSRGRSRAQSSWAYSQRRPQSSAGSEPQEVSPGNEESADTVSLASAMSAVASSHRASKRVSKNAKDDARGMSITQRKKAVAAAEEKIAAERTRLMDVWAQMKSEREQLKSELAKGKSEKKELDQAKSALEKEKNEVMSARERFFTECEFDAETSETDVIESVKKWRNEAGETEILHKQIRTLELKVNRLTEEAKADDEERSRLESQNAALKVTCDTLRMESEKHSQESTSAHAAADEELGKVRAELAKVRGELKKVQSDHAQLTVELNALTVSYDQSQSELGALRASRDQLEICVNEQASSLKAKTAELQKNSARIETLLSQRDSWHTDEEALLTREANLREQADDLQQQIDALEEAQNKLKASVQRLDNREASVLARERETARLSEGFKSREEAITEREQTVAQRENDIQVRLNDLDKRLEQLATPQPMLDSTVVSQISDGTEQKQQQEVHKHIHELRAIRKSLAGYLVRFAALQGKSAGNIRTSLVDDNHMLDAKQWETTLSQLHVTLKTLFESTQPSGTPAAVLPETSGSIVSSTAGLSLRPVVESGSPPLFASNGDVTKVPVLDATAKHAETGIPVPSNPNHPTTQSSTLVTTPSRPPHTHAQSDGASGVAVVSHPASEPQEFGDLRDYMVTEEDYKSPNGQLYQDTDAILAKVNAFVTSTHEPPAPVSVPVINAVDEPKEPAPVVIQPKRADAREVSSGVNAWSRLFQSKKTTLQEHINATLTSPDDPKSCSGEQLQLAFRTEPWSMYGTLPSAVRMRALQSRYNANDYTSGVEMNQDSIIEACSDHLKWLYEQLHRACVQLQFVRGNLKNTAGELSRYVDRFGKYQDAVGAFTRSNDDPIDDTAALQSPNGSAQSPQDSAQSPEPSPQSPEESQQTARFRVVIESPPVEERVSALVSSVFSDVETPSNVSQTGADMVQNIAFETPSGPNTSSNDNSGSDLIIGRTPPDSGNVMSIFQNADASLGSPETAKSHSTPAVGESKGQTNTSEKKSKGKRGASKKSKRKMTVRQRSLASRAKIGAKSKSKSKSKSTRAASSGSKTSTPGRQRKNGAKVRVPVTRRRGRKITARRKVKTTALNTNKSLIQERKEKDNDKDTTVDLKETSGVTSSGTAPDSSNGGLMSTLFGDALDSADLTKLIQDNSGLLVDSTAESDVWLRELYAKMGVTPVPVLEDDDKSTVQSPPVTETGPNTPVVANPNRKWTVVTAETPDDYVPPEHTAPDVPKTLAHNAEIDQDRSGHVLPASDEAVGAMNVQVGASGVDLVKSGVQPVTLSPEELLAQSEARVTGLQEQVSHLQRVVDSQKIRLEEQAVRSLYKTATDEDSLNGRLKQECASLHALVTSMQESLAPACAAVSDAKMSLKDGMKESNALANASVVAAFAVDARDTISKQREELTYLRAQCENLRQETARLNSACGKAVTDRDRYKVAYERSSKVHTVLLDSQRDERIFHHTSRVEFTNALDNAKFALKRELRDLAASLHRSRTLTHDEEDGNGAVSGSNGEGDGDILEDQADIIAHDEAGSDLSTESASPSQMTEGAVGKGLDGIFNDNLVVDETEVKRSSQPEEDSADEFTHIVDEICKQLHTITGRNQQLCLEVENWQNRHRDLSADHHSVLDELKQAREQYLEARRDNGRMRKELKTTSSQLADLQSNEGGVEVPIDGKSRRFSQRTSRLSTNNSGAHRRARSMNTRTRRTRSQTANNRPGHRSTASTSVLSRPSRRQRSRTTVSDKTERPKRSSHRATRNSQKRGTPQDDKTFASDRTDAIASARTDVSTEHNPELPGNLLRVRYSTFPTVDEERKVDVSDKPTAEPSVMHIPAIPDGNAVDLATSDNAMGNLKTVVRSPEDSMDSPPRFQSRVLNSESPGSADGNIEVPSNNGAYLTPLRGQAHPDMVMRDTSTSPGAARKLHAHSEQDVGLNGDSFGGGAVRSVDEVSVSVSTVPPVSVSAVDARAPPLSDIYVVHTPQYREWDDSLPAAHNNDDHQVHNHNVGILTDINEQDVQVEGESEQIEGLVDTHSAPESKSLLDASRDVPSGNVDIEGVTEGVRDAGNAPAVHDIVRDVASENVLALVENVGEIDSVASNDFGEADSFVGELMPVDTVATVKSLVGELDHSSNSQSVFQDAVSTVNEHQSRNDDTSNDIQLNVPPTTKGNTEGDVVGVADVSGGGDSVNVSQEEKHGVQGETAVSQPDVVSSTDPFLTQPETQPSSNQASVDVQSSQNTESQVPSDNVSGSEKPADPKLPRKLTRGTSSSRIVVPVTRKVDVKRPPNARAQPGKSRSRSGVIGSRSSVPKTRSLNTKPVRTTGSPRKSPQRSRASTGQMRSPVKSPRASNTSALKRSEHKKSRQNSSLYRVQDHTRRPSRTTTSRLSSGSARNATTSTTQNTNAGLPASPPGGATRRQRRYWGRRSGSNTRPM